ncbi:MAG TPA: hypothetical protein VN541_13895 [Tepidisphaeraceae bacterium]|nr:hypothetical protein [Tepidisphaeraceae bacterium]
MSESTLTSLDPAEHRQREHQLIQHVERLLEDERMRIDTILGRRPITAFTRDVSRSDKSVELKRMMTDMNIPDRDLQNRMPVGEMLEVTLWQRKMWVLRQTVGRLKVVCIAPTRSLLRGDQPQPMTPTEVNKALSQIQTSSNSPTTVVLLSTAGYTMEAHELAERRADRTVILVEPNEAGGWTVTGPVETKALSDLFDPENEDEKRKRVREVIDESKLELLTGGIAVDKVITRTKLPVQVVEAELKAYAKNTPGLVAKRLDGRLVLFREGTVLPPQAASAAGGSAMPLIDRVKALFSRKGESEKKIAFLSERRAALSQQRDRAYEEMGVLEQQESTLKDQFKNAAGSITKRRITSQLLQLRKDLDRRQQLLSVLNQQINVISTHLHNLELVQQGQVASLPNTDEMTADAVKAEEVLAELEASAEIAGTTGALAGSGMTAEEQALFEELERETGQAQPATAAPGTSASAPTRAPVAAEPTPESHHPEGESVASAPQRNEPEPG